MAKTILIATLGAEPQVVTLTLDALFAMGIRVDMVIVTHTNTQHEPIRSALECLNEEFVIKKYYGDIIYKTYPLTSDDGILDDVVSAQDIESAFNSLYTLIRHHKQAGNTIHLCIAGGRKTTTVFALSVANALFDANDAIWYLVSQPEVIASKSMHVESGVELVPVVFLHPPSTDANQQRVDLFLNYILTDAEREIVRLIVHEGLSNQEIALRLHKSIKTIANQLTTIYDKLRLHFKLDKAPDRAMLIVMLYDYI